MDGSFPAGEALRRETPLAGVLLCATGAVAVGLSPIFVRLSDVAPEASAFWRAMLALPLLALWAKLERGAAPVRGWRFAWVAGAFFAGDLIFWHLSILNTTLANASFLTNVLPVLFVTLAAWALFADRPTRRFVVGMVLALVSAVLLAGASVDLDPRFLTGDFQAVVTAMFLSAYVLALKTGGRAPGGATALRATAATTALILPVSLLAGGAFWPQSLEGWVAVIALGVVCQGLGQGAIVASLRLIPAGVAAVIILLEPLTTVVVGWVWLGEPLSGIQLIGGFCALAAILVVRERQQKRPQP